MGAFVLLLAFLGQSPKLDHDLGAELSPEVKAYLDARFERVDIKIEAVKKELLVAIAELKPKPVSSSVAKSAAALTIKAGAGLGCTCPGCNCDPNGTGCTCPGCNCAGGGTVGSALTSSQPTLYYTDTPAGLFGRRVRRTFTYQSPAAASAYAKPAGVTYNVAAPVTTVRSSTAVRGYCLPNGQCFYPAN